MYTIEMSLKILGMGFLFNKKSYLRDRWNILDFIIVSTSLLTYAVGNTGVNLSSLRTLRGTVGKTLYFTFKFFGP